MNISQVFGDIVRLVVLVLVIYAARTCSQDHGLEDCVLYDHTMVVHRALDIAEGVVFDFLQPQLLYLEYFGSPVSRKELLLFVVDQIDPSVELRIKDGALPSV
ncbi:hypothetical protein K466DRAFT_570071 [Polyporus arcularius HHB13444]|uniref:Uncharacterized protein n=1 Tax=Polyporus arcularius HHB13444 TaxID=1314778 RepID=A0A5C3P1W8_9APHY|nr:hypothetical protein K466DRAFT_570071 [Polyporus arcularius HHB13444]